jgi:hypothetical protein
MKQTSNKLYDLEFTDKGKKHIIYGMTQSEIEDFKTKLLEQPNSDSPL